MPSSISFLISPCKMLPVPWAPLICLRTRDATASRQKAESKAAAKPISMVSTSSPLLPSKCGEIFFPYTRWQSLPHSLTPGRRETKILILSFTSEHHLPFLTSITNQGLTWWVSIWSSRRSICYIHPVHRDIHTLADVCTGDKTSSPQTRGWSCST